MTACRSESVCRLLKTRGTFQKCESGGLDGPFELCSVGTVYMHRIRNMWQFANLFQFILLFGQALKLDDNLDIEVRPIPVRAVLGLPYPQQDAMY